MRDNEKSRFSLRGRVAEVDRSQMTFRLEPAFGPAVSGPIPGRYLKTALDALRGYPDGARVLVQGIGRYDYRNELTGMESVQAVTLLAQLDVPACLDEFRALEPGWLEGDGLAPSSAGLDWLADAFVRLYPSDAPLPHTYPTPEGGVRMEWSQGANVIVLEIDLNSRIGEWLWFDRNSDAEMERTLDLDVPDSWEWLVSEILAKLALAE